MLHDAEPWRHLKFMDEHRTIMENETGTLRFWRAVIWISIFAACAIFWIAAGVAILNWIL